MRSIPTLGITVALIAGTFVTPATGGPRKLDHALQQIATHANGTVDVIVRVVPGTEDNVRGRLTKNGRALKAEHPSIHALTATVAVSDLANLADDPSVASVSLDAEVSAHQTLSGPDSLIPLNVVRTLIGSTATGVTGQGVGVAVIDSGFQNRPDLHAQIKAFYDFTIDGTARPSPPVDPFGHGTHIGATIASTGQES